MNAPDIQHLPGFTPRNQDIRLINRTGAAIARGDCVSINLGFTGSTGVNMTGLSPENNEDGGAGYVFNAAVPCAAGNRNLFGAIALDDIPDNAVGRFRVEGRVDALVAVANGGTTLSMPASGRALAASPIGALGTASIPIATAAVLLENNSSGANAIRPVLFSGGELWRRVIGGA